MSHGPSKIPTKGCCIYCGKTDVKLTDEHFLPFSLGGQHVIEKASCHACADITKTFEQHVARDMWGDARNSYNAPSRRRKTRPSHITLRDPDDPIRAVRVPYKGISRSADFLQNAPRGPVRGFAGKRGHIERVAPCRRDG